MENKLTIIKRVTTISTTTENGKTVRSEVVEESRGESGDLAIIERFEEKVRKASSLFDHFCSLFREL